MSGKGECDILLVWHRKFRLSRALYSRYSWQLGLKYLIGGRCLLWCEVNESIIIYRSLLWRLFYKYITFLLLPFPAVWCQSLLTLILFLHFSCKSGSSENINTNWKPAEGSISNTKTKHKSISARAGSATAKPPLNKEKPPREPSVLPSPHLSDINYEFLHNQSHRIYMHIYR